MKKLISLLLISLISLIASSQTKQVNNEVHHQMFTMVFGSNSYVVDSISPDKYQITCTPWKGSEIVYTRPCNRYRYLEILAWKEWQLREAAKFFLKSDTLVIYKINYYEK